MTKSNATDLLAELVAAEVEKRLPSGTMAAVKMPTSPSIRPPTLEMPAVVSPSNMDAKALAERSILLAAIDIVLSWNRRHKKLSTLNNQETALHNAVLQYEAIVNGNSR